MINVWLDDELDMPAGYDVHVRTAAEAIALIDTGTVSSISLDNDLGPPGAGEGRQVAAHIERLAFEGAIPEIRCRVHTGNPVARREMLAAIGNACRYWEENGR